jgi:hypothetical protein
MRIYTARLGGVWTAEVHDAIGLITSTARDSFPASVPRDCRDESVFVQALKQAFPTAVICRRDFVDQPTRVWPDLYRSALSQP